MSAVPHVIFEVVALIKKDAPYWAPELKARLAPFLDHYGKPLFDALKALPEDEQAMVGVDRFVEQRAS